MHHKIERYLGALSDENYFLCLSNALALDSPCLLPVRFLQPHDEAISCIVLRTLRL